MVLARDLRLCRRDSRVGAIVNVMRVMMRRGWATKARKSLGYVSLNM